MGNSFSIFVNSVGSHPNNRILHTLDVIARDLIFKTKLTDLMKLNNPANCERIIAITKNLLNKMTQSQVEYWSKLPP